MTVYNIAGNEVDFDLQEGDHLTGVLLVGLVQRLDEAGETVIIGHSEGMSYVTQLGLVMTAEDYIRYPVDVDEDD